MIMLISHETNEHKLYIVITCIRILEVSLCPKCLLITVTMQIARPTLAYVGVYKNNNNSDFEIQYSLIFKRILLSLD